MIWWARWVVGSLYALLELKRESLVERLRARVDPSYGGDEFDEAAWALWSRVDNGVGFGLQLSVALLWALCVPLSSLLLSLSLPRVRHSALASVLLSCDVCSRTLRTLQLAKALTAALSITSLLNAAAHAALVCSALFDSRKSNVCALIALRHVHALPSSLHALLQLDGLCSRNRLNIIVDSFFLLLLTSALLLRTLPAPAEPAFVVAAALFWLLLARNSLAHLANARTFVQRFAV